MSFQPDVAYESVANEKKLAYADNMIDSSKIKLILMKAQSTVYILVVL